MLGKHAIIRRIVELRKALPIATGIIFKDGRNPWCRNGLSLHNGLHSCIMQDKIVVPMVETEFQG